MRCALFNWNDGSWDISSLPLLFNGVIRVSFCIFPIILNLVSLETSPEKLFWNVNLRQFLLPVWWPSVLQKEHKIVFFIPFATLLAENTEDMALEIVLLASNDDNTPFLCVATLLVHNAEDMALGIVPLASNDDNTPFLCVSRMGTSLFLDWPFTSSRLGILTSELVPFPCCAQRVPLLVFDENSVEYVLTMFVMSWRKFSFDKKELESNWQSAFLEENYLQSIQFVLQMPNNVLTDVTSNDLFFHVPVDPTEKKSAAVGRDWSTDKQNELYSKDSIIFEWLSVEWTGSDIGVRRC